MAVTTEDALSNGFIQEYTHYKHHRVMSGPLIRQVHTLTQMRSKLRCQKLSLVQMSRRS